MTASRSLLRDLALLLLAVATVAAAAYVVLRPAGPSSVQQVQEVPEPAAPERPQALVLTGDTAVDAGGIAEAAAAQLGWEMVADEAPGTGYITGPEGSRFPERLESGALDADVVLIMSNADPAEEADGAVLGGNVQRAVSLIRKALPEAEVVLVGPIAPGEETAELQREVLTQVAARFGAFYVDPVGRRYVDDDPALLTPGEVGELGARLAADLRVVLPAHLLPEDVNGR